MPDFFIARPVFAWVVAIFIMIAGALAIPFLPVAQYPNIAPAKISVTANYPGASSEEIYQGVVRLIEMAWRIRSCMRSPPMTPTASRQSTNI